MVSIKYIQHGLGHRRHDGAKKDRVFESVMVEIASRRTSKGAARTEVTARKSPAVRSVVKRIVKH